MIAEPHRQSRQIHVKHAQAILARIAEIVIAQRDTSAEISNLNNQSAFLALESIAEHPPGRMAMIKRSLSTQRFVRTLR